MTMCASTEQEQELFLFFLWISLMRLTCLSRRISCKLLLALIGQNTIIICWKPNGPWYTSSQIWTANWSSYRASCVVLKWYRCCSIKYTCIWQATFHYSCEEGCGASEKWPSFWLYLNLKIFCLVTYHRSLIYIHYCL